MRGRASGRTAVVLFDPDDRGRARPYRLPGGLVQIGRRELLTYHDDPVLVLAEHVRRGEHAGAARDALVLVDRYLHGAYSTLDDHLSITWRPRSGPRPDRAAGSFGRSRSRRRSRSPATGRAAGPARPGSPAGPG